MRSKQIAADSLAMLALIIFASGALAEVFVTTGDSAQILVFDNLDDGLDIEPKRNISGLATGLSFTFGLDIYTASEPDSETEIFTCDPEQNTIFVFPLDADGDVAPTRSLNLGADRGCARVAVYQDEMFTGSESGIHVYHYLDEDLGQAVEPLREIIWDAATFAAGFVLYGLEVKDDEIFALLFTSEQDAQGQHVSQIWVFDVTANGDAQQEVKRVITGHPDTVSGASLFVTADEILMSTAFRVQPNSLIQNALVVFDRQATGPAAPIRVLNAEETLLSSALLGSELFFAANNGDGIRVYDARSSGPAEVKRVIGATQGLWDTAVDLVITPEDDPVGPTFELSLEEPVDGAVHSGVSNLRGWAVASEGIEKVEIYVDGELFQSAPYGGNRADVGFIFSSVPGASQSGFSLAYNYNAIDIGSHTISAVAYTASGKTRAAEATFEVVSPGREFVTAAEGVDLSEASCTIERDGIHLEGLVVAGEERWGAVLDWRRASQGFEVQAFIPEDQ